MSHRARGWGIYNLSEIPRMRQGEYLIGFHAAAEPLDVIVFQVDYASQSIPSLFTFYITVPFLTNVVTDSHLEIVT